MPPDDFSKRRYFPGTTGNPFDIWLHKLVELQNFPSVLFIAILLILAALPHFGNFAFSLVLFAFFLLDWLLISSLPRAHRSFGPSRPTVLLLAIFRTVAAVLPDWWSIPLQVLGTLLVVYGFWIEPQRLVLTHQRIQPESFTPSRPLRLLHVGDLHVERLTQREVRLNQLIRETKPDIILFSGDFLNLSYLRDPLAWESLREMINDWSAPLGVYAVTGSPAVDLEDVIPSLLDRTPLTWLQDQRVDILFEDQCLHLVGLSCSHKPFVDGSKLDKLVSNQHLGFSILLYHSPDLAPYAAHLGFSLQLSGHTHGGQIRLPFLGAFYAGSLYGKKFEAGRISINGMILYVTRGVGMEGAAAPRVRFLCPPEVILWEIG
jgi:predicted MPP superfamily phosphohydrolase